MLLRFATAAWFTSLFTTGRSFRACGAPDRVRQFDVLDRPCDTKVRALGKELEDEVEEV